MISNLMRAIINSIGATPLLPRKVRWVLLRVYGIEAETWNVRSRCFFGGRDISIGRGSMINQGCVFDNLGRISIGSQCAIGMEVVFAASTHELGTGERRAGAPAGGPIVVEDGCWIGSRSVLLPGSVVGRGCVVGAGSVVSGHLDRDGLYHGVPARRVRDLAD